MGASGHPHRSAPVPGRSKLRMAQRVGVFGCLCGYGHCCARGRAHSGVALLGGGSVEMRPRCIGTASNSHYGSVSTSLSHFVSHFVSKTPQKVGDKVKDKVEFVPK